MNEAFKIYVQRLVDGKVETIKERLNPDFMDIHESELNFSSPIEIEGSAEVSNFTLILKLAINCHASMPCAICNQIAAVTIKIPDFCHTVEMSEIKGDVFDLRDVLREAILLEVPMIAECGGRCPERDRMADFFSCGQNSKDKFHPFKDL